MSTVAIYSDATETAEFQNEIDALNLGKTEVVTNSEFRINWDSDLFVLNISKLDSTLWRELIEQDNINPDSVFITSYSNDALLISNIVKAGFSKIYVLPDENLQFRNEVNTYLELINARRKIGSLNDNFDYLFDLVVGKSDHANELRGLINNICDNPQSSLLITGETGTGKGLLAKIIHDITHKDKPEPFIDIMATAIPENLLESELFGYEKGAFTDARSSKKGLFELAGRGTIFLDEIGDISKELQAKLLRVLERKEVRRVGGLKAFPFHARIITATNQDLDSLIEKKKFREDLYYRINTIPIELKPLRERGDDMLDIAEYYLSVYCKEFNNFFYELSGEVKQLFKAYSWPGNIRELKNVIERAVMLNEGQTLLELKHFPQILKNVKGFVPKPPISETRLSKSIKLEVDPENEELRSVEKLYAIELLSKYNGSKTLTAKKMGISRPKLNTLLNS